MFEVGSAPICPELTVLGELWRDCALRQKVALIMTESTEVLQMGREHGVILPPDAPAVLQQRCVSSVFGLGVVLASVPSYGRYKDNSRGVCSFSDLIQVT